MMRGTPYASLFPLLIAAFVVFRFAFRELRERTVKASSIWIRPAILAVLTALLIFESVSLDPSGIGFMVGSLAVGVVLGAVTGLAIVRNTTFAPADRAGAVRVRGNRVTLAIWIGAFAVRLLARYLFPFGGDPRAQLPLNCGTVVLVAVAFAIIAIAFQRAIATYGIAAPAGGAIRPQ